MKKFFSSCLVVWALLAALALAACGPQETILTDADREAVLAFSEPATDNLFAGLVAGDYAVFAQDFDADMQTAMPESGFATFQQEMAGKIGNYVSREVDKVSQLGEFYVVTYNAKFELDEPVTVRVVFRMTDPHNVSGLWFDSAKLREK